MTISVIILGKDGEEVKARIPMILGSVDGSAITDSDIIEEAWLVAVADNLVDAELRADYVFLIE